MVGTLTVSDAAQPTPPSTTATVDPQAAESAVAAQATITAQATMIAVFETEQADAQVTATALAVVAANSVLDPTRQSFTIQTDLEGMLAGDEGALEEARAALATALSRYPQGQCRAGFILVSGKAPSIEGGIGLAERVSALLREVRSDVFTADTGEELFALPNEPPSGEAGVDVFFYSGCQPIG